MDVWRETRKYDRAIQRRIERQNVGGPAEKGMAEARAEYQRTKNPEWNPKGPYVLRHNTKLGVRIRVRLYSALKGTQYFGTKEGYELGMKYLRCTIPELRAHLERQFTEGMTWENWKLRGWHIDHIRQLNTFDLSDAGQLAVACHYTNLRPLWAKENLSRPKGNKPNMRQTY